MLMQLTVDDGTNDLRLLKLAFCYFCLRPPPGCASWAPKSPTYLVNLAITNASSARKSGVRRKSSRGRLEDTSGGRGLEGRASRAGDGGNAATEEETDS